ncbi:hypothetical protein T4B_8631 [Trichinella pseudospiralis]|uniref:Uncharacterized protein n=2 Tax=Trichinella pseudospiralis TaxID=6337 RepID=A0A0V1G2L2_TRIPS|nr:hypothetical protein T4A_6807 [Trichinella pseudospiralis]KRY92473.1 hypothetical protein T4D_266 [Trichinella pseudospiralis]KRZ34743.1 hypothetical protein T4B_8631 [Trichinella pseudospiralis]KRZ45992.1 hypothetical protein T4C_11424 [Trichinella pseudospiralis]
MNSIQLLHGNKSKLFREMRISYPAYLLHRRNILEFIELQSMNQLLVAHTEDGKNAVIYDPS